MPHVSSGSGGDDLGSTDEVKVFKDEGEDEKRASENLTEEKSSLIDLTESEEKVVSGQSYSSSKSSSRNDTSPVFGKSDPTPHSSAFNMGYLVSPYPYHNGTTPSIPVSMRVNIGSDALRRLMEADRERKRRRKVRLPGKVEKLRSRRRRLYRECYVERALYRWYSRRSERPSQEELLKKALVFAKRLGADSAQLKNINEEWVVRWAKRFGLDKEGYSQDQTYACLCLELDWGSLPGLNSGQERVWILSAGNLSGRHRTRLLITGKEWRPDCLKHVNMLSQPVVYAGGGVGRPTPDLFAWWFHREFAPAALALNSNGAVLVAEEAEYLPPAEECVAANGKVKLVIKPPDGSLDLVKTELKTRYAMLLIHSISIEGLSGYTLKDAFPLLHRAWLNVRPDVFSRSPSQPTEEDRVLLLELQWMCQEAGLEVDEASLRAWTSDSEPHGSGLKTEPQEELQDVPNAAEAAALLSKALLWMESEPIEPSYLLVLRDIIAIAKQASKMGLGTGPTTLPFFCHNGDPLGQPPPAHMGIPPYQLDKPGGEWRSSDWKRLLASGLTRPPMYPFTTGQYPYPMLSPEISQVAASWHTPTMYPISSGSAGFRSPYPSSLPITTASLPSDFYRFSPTGLMGPHPGLSPHSHPAIVTPGPKQELGSNDISHRSSSMDHKSSSSTNDSQKSQDSGHGSNNQDKKKPHIKKPLNAFMLYMKEMRAKVVAECTLKESAAINQILGRRWHSLTREEQAKYYEKARIERQLHMELYPGWSARDNYGYGAKKKKRKKERVTITDSGGNSMKKCRARYGLDQQSQWCKPCRRKKKCIRYKECGDDGTTSEDNLGSVDSMGDSHASPDCDVESYQQSSGSSPGGLSGLSSLTSPGLLASPGGGSLASPSVSLASPSLQSPLTPMEQYDIKPPLPLPVVRNPVGTNPHDANNPLSVNQLTGKCIKNSSPPPSHHPGAGKEARTVISVP